MAEHSSGKTARIVVVFNEKGGSGKTTVTTQLAGTLGLRGYDVMVADLDSQEATSKWLALKKDGSFPATLWTGHRYGSKVSGEFEKLIHKYDIIVVDCAPSVEQPSTWASLLVADLGLIPTRMGPSDLGALPAAKSLAKRAVEETGRDIPVRVLPVSVRMHYAPHVSIVKSFLNDKAFPMFMLPAVNEKDVEKWGKKMPMTLGDRVAHTNGMYVGGTAHDMRGGKDAVTELETLADLVLHQVGLPAKPGKGRKQ